jgi:riboflavin kinase/FMN adenylyltransferase
MKLIRDLHALHAADRGGVVTIGNYDGVHRGHQHMLAAVRTKAQELGAPATVVTFEPTPREYFEGDAAPARLMRLREKVETLPLYGVQQLVVLRFDRRMQCMSAVEFVDRLLVAGLRTRHLVVGHDFHFARKREGTVETLREAGRRHGFDVEEVGRFLSDGERVSSSLVREALGRGDLDRAGALIGRPYRMAGRVRKGQQLGRKLGFPTANLALHRKVVPLWGVFAVRVSGPGLVDHPAVVSLGTRPTINGTVPLLEVHLFDYSGDLYGQYLDVDFVRYLREERRFESLDSLVEQMHLDAAQARAALGISGLNC